jgi:hypothetical protein
MAQVPVGRRNVAIVNVSGTDVTITINNRRITLKDRHQRNEVFTGTVTLKATAKYFTDDADSTWVDNVAHDHEVSVSRAKRKGNDILKIASRMRAYQVPDSDSDEEETEGL